MRWIWGKNTSENLLNDDDKCFRKIHANVLQYILIVRLNVFVYLKGLHGILLQMRLICIQTNNKVVCR